MTCSCANLLECQRQHCRRILSVEDNPCITDEVAAEQVPIDAREFQAYGTQIGLLGVLNASWPVGSYVTTRRADNHLLSAIY
jgi:hypothetical protein